MMFVESNGAGTAEAKADFRIWSEITRADEEDFRGIRRDRKGSGRLSVYESDQYGEDGEPLSLDQIIHD